MSAELVKSSKVAEKRVKNFQLTTFSDAPGRNKSGFGRARALKIGLRAGSGFHYKNPGGLGLRKSGRGLKCTICPTKFEWSRALEVPSKGGVG